MTREEAIIVLKGLYNNPLFGDVHKAAFNIAIHDIKAYQKWNLNELVLTQKDNEQKPILDKISAVIKSLKRFEIRGEVTPLVNVERVLEIIDKAESEVEDGECK